MKRPFLFTLFVVSLCLAVMTQTIAAVQEETQNALPSSLVTTEILEAKIAEVEAAVDLSDDVKTRLVELCHCRRCVRGTV